MGVRPRRRMASIDRPRGFIYIHSLMADLIRADRWRILPVILLAPLMGSLDGSIVNVALPTIARRLDVGMDGVQWVVSSYLIVISALVLIFGKVADKIGKTGIFEYGFLAFGAGSALCALAWSLPVLILARVFQAIGASMFMSSNQAIIATLFPHEERGKALGLLGTTVAIGTMIGPPLGGFMVDFLDWPSLFLINIPISIFAFVAARKLIPGDAKGGSPSGFDFVGSALFVGFIGGLFYFLLSGQGRGWGAPTQVASVAGAAACGLLFIARERRVADPMIDLSIFRIGLFSLSVACVLIVFVATFCVNIVLPFYLQDALGLSPSGAGLLLLASPLASGLIAPLSGHLSDKFGAKALTVIGLSIVLAGLVMLSGLGLGSSPGLVAACLAIFGAGSGVFGSPNTKLIMSHAPKDKLGIAGSINALARNMGMVTGIAFAVALLFGSMSARAGESVSGFDPMRPELFIFGMRTVFRAAALICAAAIALTLGRALKRESGISLEGRR
jgi:EmrB/QacA subfamily drug resistance transporter